MCGRVSHAAASALTGREKQRHVVERIKALGGEVSIPSLTSHALMMACASSGKEEMCALSYLSRDDKAEAAGRQRKHWWNERTCIFIFMRMFMCVCIYAWVCLSLCVCVYVCVCVCVCVCV